MSFSAISSAESVARDASVKQNRRNQPVSSGLFSESHTNMSKEETLTQDRIVALRQELKAWEKSFSAANAGRKPGRDDIKQNAAIGMHAPVYGESTSASLTDTSGQIQRI